MDTCHKLYSYPQKYEITKIFPKIFFPVGGHFKRPPVMSIDYMCVVVRGWGIVPH